MFVYFGFSKSKELSLIITIKDIRWTWIKTHMLNKKSFDNDVQKMGIKYKEKNRLEFDSRFFEKFSFCKIIKQLWIELDWKAFSPQQRAKS